MKFKITSTGATFDQEDILKKYPILKDYHFEFSDKESEGFITVNTLEELIALQKAVRSCKDTLGLILFSNENDGNEFELEIYDDWRE